METPDDSTEAKKDAPPSPGTRAVAEALGACVAEALKRGHAAQVPGLGTFRVKHEASQMSEQQGGRFSVAPPRDVVVFEPAAR